jgi:hypothetical protein
MPGFGSIVESLVAREHDHGGKYDRLNTSSPPPEALPPSEDSPSFDIHQATQRRLNRHLKTFQSSKKKELVIMTSAFVGSLLFLYWVIG